MKNKTMIRSVTGIIFDAGRAENIHIQTPRESQV